jgi:UTP:GlnB (protein PII) uridylyltransferase
VVKRSLLVLTADLAACGQLLANSWKQLCLNQIQFYFSVNKLTTDFKHAFRERHSTCTALTQMTDDWLKEKIVETVMLDFSAAFDMIDYNLLLRKCVLWLSNLCHRVNSDLSI